RRVGHSSFIQGQFSLFPDLSLNCGGRGSGASGVVGGSGIRRKTHTYTQAHLVHAYAAIAQHVELNTHAHAHTHKHTHTHIHTNTHTHTLTYTQTRTHTQTHTHTHTHTLPPFHPKPHDLILSLGSPEDCVVCVCVCVCVLLSIRLTWECPQRAAVLLDPAGLGLGHLRLLLLLLLLLDS